MKIRKLTMLLGAAAMGILILDSRGAIRFASEGLELCIRTVIPSLFPFCVVGMVLTRQLQSVKLLRPVGYFFQLPPGAESILLTGLLGGYPIGAQNAANAFHAGVITRDEANRMLSFCSQPGPAFIFGILGSVFTLGQCWLLWGIVIFSALLVSRIFPKHDAPCPGKEAPRSDNSPILSKAVSAMGNICAWIILMRIVLGFLQRWILWRLSVPAQYALSGILELTNGCCMLSSVPDPGLRFILAAGMLSFGGICVLLQTKSQTPGLDIRCYLAGKLLQSAICISLAAAVQGYTWATVPLLAGIGWFRAGKSRKNSSIPAPVGV